MALTSSPPARGIPSSPVRVLIVEDHPDLARVTALCLEQHAFQTRTVDRGDIAHAAAVAFRPHFVLLDIGLPGLDGYQVSRAIREDASLDEAVIIALSAYGPEMYTDHRRSAIFDHYFTKPVDFDSLLPVLLRK